MVWKHHLVQVLLLLSALDLQHLAEEEQGFFVLKVVEGVVEVLVSQGGRWGEEEVDVWAPGLELWGHQAGSQQEALVMVGRAVLHG